MDKLNLSEMLQTKTTELTLRLQLASKIQEKILEQSAEKIKILTDLASESFAKKFIELQLPSSALETIQIIGKSAIDFVESYQKSVINSTKIIDELLLKFRMSDREAVKLLQRYKWFITPNMPIQIVHYIANLSKKKGNHLKAINEMFASYFLKNKCRNLENMVLSWKRNPLFKKRMNIFIDCVNTLKNIQNKNINAANVLLPTIISQIDGILTDYLTSKGIPSKTSYNFKKTEFLKLKNNITIISDEWDNNFIEVFVQILFQKSYTGQSLEKAFNFNRHKIIHGENIKYGRKDYLIRGFLILEVLSYLS
jgi:hypothetical protein